jgi:hypothetical protein
MAKMAKGGEIEWGEDLGDGFSVGNDVYITDSKSMFKGKIGFVSGLAGKDLLVTISENGNERSVVVSKKGVEKLDAPEFAYGGMTAGRWYKDNSGEEFRYVGEDSTGNELFSDGQRTFAKPTSDFEAVPKEKKLFKFFRLGGALKDSFLEEMADLHSNIKEVTLKDGSKISHDELMEAHQFLSPNESQEYYASMQYRKGGTFDSKVNAIAKKLEGKPVPAPYRKEYGSRYDKEDAKEAATRIVGNMRKLYGE